MQFQTADSVKSVEAVERRATETGKGPWKSDFFKVRLKNYVSVAEISHN